MNIRSLLLTLALGASMCRLTAPVCSGESPSSFYSAEIFGCQRLPNGNTLICEGFKGNLFEVTAAGEMVWRYICPVTEAVLTQGETIPADPDHADQLMYAVFRVQRYAPNFPCLAGRDLTPQGPIELSGDQVFIRGDSNSDGTTNISDAISLLGYLFLGDTNVPCGQAGEANDDGELDISDAVSVLIFLFLGEKAIEPPLGACSVDLTVHDLRCDSFPACE